MTRKLNGWTIVIIAGVIAFLATVVVLAEEPMSPAQASKHDGAGSHGHYDLFGPRVWPVRCDLGVKLSRVLLRAGEGDRLEIRGTCTESVVVDRDGLQLVGIDGAIIDGSSSPSEAVILIDGARGVLLEALTVQNGADQGVLARGQAQGHLRGVILTGHGTVGLSLDGSHFDLADVSMDDNGAGGMDAYTGSTVVMRGDISARRNGGDGLAANGQTFLELRGARVDASGNRGSGVNVINDSRLQIFSFPEAQGSSISADSNGFAGVGLLGSELGVVGSQFFGSGANVISATNNAVGYFMPAGSILSPHATGRFVAEGNFVGMVLEDGASLLVVGGLNVSQNVEAGLDADGAGTLNVVSLPPNPSFVVDNGLDLDLTFGTRGTFHDMEAGSVDCDDTVLVRGSVACPAAE